MLKPKITIKTEKAFGRKVYVVSRGRKKLEFRNTKKGAEALAKKLEKKPKSYFKKF